MEEKIALSTLFKLVILFTATVLTGYVYGILLTFGSILKSMLDKYQESRSTVASVQAILVGVGFSSGVFCGVFIARLGLWKSTFMGATLCSFGFILSFFTTSVVHLYFLIGGIAGLGTAIIYLSSTTALGMAYEGQQRVVAVSIQHASISVTGISLPYFFNYLAHKYGVNGTFLIIGGLCLNCFPASRLFAILERHYSKEHPKAECKDHEDCNNEEEKTPAALAKHGILFLKQRVWTILTPPYIFNCLGTGVTVGTVIAFLSLMIDVLAWKGCSDSIALLGFPVAYATGFVARVLATFVKNCNTGQSLMVPTVYTIGGCCGFLMIFMFSSVPVILTGCGLIGIAISGVISASLLVAVQIVDEEHISVGVGLVISTVGIASAALGPLFGKMRDSTQTYGYVLLLASGLQALGVCLYIAAIISWRLAGKTSIKTEENMDQKNSRNLEFEITYL